MIHIFLNRLYFLEQFQGHSKTEGEVHGVPICLSPSPQKCSLSTIHMYPKPCASMLAYWWTNIDTSLLTEVHSLLEFKLCEMHSKGFDKCIIICIHHYQIMLNSFIALFIALKIPSGPPILSFLPSNLQQPLTF